MEEEDDKNLIMSERYFCKYNYDLVSAQQTNGKLKELLTDKNKKM
jgi:hypothetical protein